jgi:hypothetical protein
MKKSLKNITLLGIDCLDISRLKLAADICQKDFEFGAVKLLSSIPDSDSRVVAIDPISSTAEYSEFCIKKMNDFVDTEFVLVIQYDGFILNPEAWTDEFLEYDYIGAPWWYDDDCNVGNGGFSLRSKKLLEILQNDSHITEFDPEDHHICRTYGPYLKEKGIKFAPESVANNFSIEGALDANAVAVRKYGNTWNTQFGFHGLQKTIISKWIKGHPEYPTIKNVLTPKFLKALKEEEYRQKNEKVYVKIGKEGEILMYKEVLNKIADNYNKNFSTLILPKTIEVDEKSSLLVLPFYEGEVFNDKWNETTGGALLGLDLSVEIPGILHELSTIDSEVALDNKELQTIPRFIFNTEQYLPEFDTIADRLISNGLLQKEETDQARDLIRQSFPSPLMINNGDFYPRNFIRTSDKKIVLIDWETWNANSRANIVDHPENIAAFCFVHMWNNLEWQKNYVKELQKRFDMKKEDFQRAILIKSLEMANFWFKEEREENPLCHNQITILRNTLNGEYMNDLWSN